MTRRPLPVHATVNWICADSEEDIDSLNAGIDIIIRWMREEKLKELQAARAKELIDSTNAEVRCNGGENPGLE